MHYNLKPKPRMAEATTFDENYGFSPPSSSEEEQSLISSGRPNSNALSPQSQRVHIKILYSIIGVLFFFIAVSSSLYALEPRKDPSLELWSPANKAVRYKTVTTDSYFFNRSPYLGTPAAEKDAMWESLYDCLPESDASGLLNETLPAPNDPTKFVIQLNVFHLLHCVNLLRKAIYPDEYPDGWTRFENGTVNHNTILGYHWDHCIDALRQSIMCDSDVTPLSFTHEHEGDYDIFPKLTATHTCRDFEAIRGWARERQVKSWLGSGPHHHEHQAP